MDALLIRFISFGFKYGEPKGLDLCIDCRALPNPYWENDLRYHNGTDEEVIRWFEGKEAVEPFFQEAIANVKRAIKTARRQGKDCLHVGLGCTGGQHRSVYMAERLAAYFAETENVAVVHREKGRYLAQ